MASVVLPTPAVPPTAEMTTVWPEAAASSIRYSAASSAARPTKSGAPACIGRGRTAVAGDGFGEPRAPSHMAVSSLPVADDYCRISPRNGTRILLPEHGPRADARRQAAPDRAAVTATVAYVIVTLPPIASMAAPVASSTTATWSGRSRVRVPWVGS